MTKYEVEMRRFQQVEVDADSLREAIAKARIEYPEWYIEFAYNAETDDGVEFVGTCEGCGEPITDGDVYSVTEDDVYICSNCGKDD